MFIKFKSWYLRWFGDLFICSQIVKGQICGGKIILMTSTKTACEKCGHP